MENNAIDYQIDLITEAMKKAGLWSPDIPDWILNYKNGPPVNFWQWLQFIHLPMRSHGILSQPDYLGPQLSYFMNNDPAQRIILQLVIELDAITSTLKTK